MNITFKVIFLFQKFQVTDWPNEDYGNFYSGDSYIILNVSYKRLSRVAKHDMGTQIYTLS